MFTLTMLLIISAAIGAALLIHGVWPRTEPTPTALTVFISAMLFRVAVTVRETVAAGGHLTRATINPESYALWAVFCLVLWLMLSYVALRHETHALVAVSRTVKAEAERIRPHPPLDHLPGEDWDAVESES